MRKARAEKQSRKLLTLLVLLMGLTLFIAGCENGTADEEEHTNGDAVDEKEEDHENDDETGEDADESENGSDNGTEDKEDDPETLAKELGIEEIDQRMFVLASVPYRDDASREAEVLGEVSAKEPVTVTGRVANDWVRVDIDGTEGFLHPVFLSEEEIRTFTWGSGEMEEEMVMHPTPKEIDAIINKQIALAPDFHPEDLVQPDVPWAEVSNYRYMRQVAAEALEDLFEAAAEDGHTLLGRTGYRSFEAQESIFINFVNNNSYEEARTFSAKPGQSEHQTGLAMDITAASVGGRLTQDLGSTEEGQWVGENAHKNGFIIRYPEGKEHITGYIYEPWHLRYVGRDLATELYESGLTMEEYFGGVE